MIMKQYYLKKDDIYLFFNVFKRNPNLKNLNQLLRFYKCFKIDINKIILNNLSIIHIKQKKETMKLIIDYGGDTNNKNNMGITPIMLQYDYETIKLLYDNNADIYQYEYIYNFNILFWQKDPQSIEFLLSKHVIVNTFNYIFYTKDKSINNIYMKLLIDGGYDPYNETFISTSPLFLQRNIESQKMILNFISKNNPYMNIDLYCETPLFKSSVTIDLIKLYLNYGENINYQNFSNSTLLHVHFNLDIILFLLQNNADLTLRNLNNETPFIYHLKRKNNDICNLIKDYYSSTLIQRNWLRYNFKKKLIPQKYYRLKIKLLNNIIHLPPSLCKKFKGGIKYQMINKKYN